MSGQGYQQYCALARTLDVVGDRWTLLIVRELWPGARRFTDLVDGLPGISRKLLTDRLRDLERNGILSRVQLPPPAARVVYELTDDGRDLATAVTPLISWGARRMGDRAPGEAFRARWSAVAMVGLADRDAAKGVREIYQYIIGDSAFHFIVADGAIELRDGRAEGASVIWTTDDNTWTHILSGKTTTSLASASGALRIVGDKKAVKRFRKIFSRRWMLSQIKSDVIARQGA
jgi:DNA-binding HxlR family transcriptional regulator/putative sterol carrier protein